MTFPARYPGECSECGAPIHIGEPIARADAYGWTHASCADDDRRDPEPRRRCWLTICDCEDRC